MFFFCFFVLFSFFKKVDRRRKSTCVQASWATCIVWPSKTDEIKDRKDKTDSAAAFHQTLHKKSPAVIFCCRGRDSSSPRACLWISFSLGDILFCRLKRSVDLNLTWICKYRAAIRCLQHRLTKEKYNSVFIFRYLTLTNRLFFCFCFFMGGGGGWKLKKITQKSL